MLTAARWIWWHQAGEWNAETHAVHEDSSDSDDESDPDESESDDEA